MGRAGPQPPPARRRARRSRHRPLLRPRHRQAQSLRRRAREPARRGRGRPRVLLRDQPRLRRRRLRRSPPPGLRRQDLAPQPLARRPAAVLDRLRPDGEPGLRPGLRRRPGILGRVRRPSRRAPAQQRGHRGPGGRPPHLGAAAALQPGARPLLERRGTHPCRVHRPAALRPPLPDRRRLHLGGRLRPGVARRQGRRPPRHHLRTDDRPAARAGGQRCALHQPRRAPLLAALHPPVRAVDPPDLPRHRRPGAGLAQHRVPRSAGRRPPRDLLRPGRAADVQLARHREPAASHTGPFGALPLPERRRVLRPPGAPGALLPLQRAVEVLHVQGPDPAGRSQPRGPARQRGRQEQPRPDRQAVRHLHLPEDEAHPALAAAQRPLRDRARLRALPLGHPALALPLPARRADRLLAAPLLLVPLGPRHDRRPAVRVHRHRPQRGAAAPRPARGPPGLRHLLHQRHRCAQGQGRPGAHGRAVPRLVFPRTEPLRAAGRRGDPTRRTAELGSTHYR